MLCNFIFYVYFFQAYMVNNVCVCVLLSLIASYKIICMLCCSKRAVHTTQSTSSVQIQSLHPEEHLCSFGSPYRVGHQLKSNVFFVLHYKMICTLCHSKRGSILLRSTWGFKIHRVYNQRSVAAHFSGPYRVAHQLKLKIIFILDIPVALYKMIYTLCHCKNGGEGGSILLKSTFKFQIHRVYTPSRFAAHFEAIFHVGHTFCTISVHCVAAKGGPFYSGAPVASK